MACPNCRSAVSERASFCTRCGTPLSKRGSTAKKILKWVGIGVGGILGLYLVIVIVVAITTDSSTPEQQEAEVSALSSWTPVEGFKKGAESGNYLKSAGKEFDDSFIQEAVFRVESDISGGSGKWIISNSDFIPVCKAYDRMGGYVLEIGMDAAVARFEDILREELSLKESVLMGGIQAGGADDPNSTTNLCEPIVAYSVGFTAAFEGMADTFDLDSRDSDTSEQLDGAINGLTRSQLRTDRKTAYDKGFLAGMDAINSRLESEQDTLNRQPFGDGLWKIGEEIIPGTYAAPGGPNCLWHFATGFSGTINDIARVGSSSSGRPIVTIETEDRGFHVVGFQTFGCGEWRPIADITDPVSSITDGVWLVGKEITPGVYQASENCFWSRLSGFKAEVTDVITGGSVAAGSTVVIEPTDAGFSSLGCGGWTRVE